MEQKEADLRKLQESPSGKAGIELQIDSEEDERDKNKSVDTEELSSTSGVADSTTVNDNSDGDSNCCRCLPCGVSIKWLVLVLLVVQATVMVLLTRYSRSTGDPSKRYLTSTAIVTGEVVKTVVAFSAIRFDGSHDTLIAVVQDVASELCHRDMLKMSVPGLLYLAQNNLLFIALSNLDAAVYQVTYQLKILTTAVCSMWMLGRVLNWLQIVALFLLAGGVALVQYGELGSSGPTTKHEEDGNTVLGLMCVLSACVSSAFAGVYLEVVFKKERKVSLWIRNVQLGLFGIGFGLLAIWFSPTQDRDIVVKDGFFRGYDAVVWIVVLVHAVGGLLIAAVIKYGDNILKGFATSISIILSSVFSVWLFSFKITPVFLAGSFLVVVAVVLYGMPPMAEPSAATPTYAKLPTEEETGREDAPPSTTLAARAATDDPREDKV